jgi:transposase
MDYIFRNHFCQRSVSMPKIKRRQYDDAYKRGAVELVLSGDRSTSEVARSLDLNAHVLRRWKKQYENNELSVEARAKQDETAALRRELSRVRMERDILKKALAIFSQVKE